MATTDRLPFQIVAVFSLILASVLSQELVITHTPKYVKFQEQKDKLPASDVPKVISHTLGVPGEDIAWRGLQQTSLFKRPKANVLISVVGYKGIEENPLKPKSVAKYPVKNDVPRVDIGNLMNSLQNAFFDRSPLLLDAGLDNNFFDIHSDLDVFKNLPDSLRKMSDRLLDMDSVLQTHTTGSLNSSSPSHLKLLGELQMIQDVFNTLSDKPELLPSKTPDLFSFTVTGLRGIADKHGAKSAETADATQLITDFVNKISGDFGKLYKDDVVVELLTLHPNSGGYVRKARSLKAVAEDDFARRVNLSPDYDENYPAIFNIILWFMITMAIVIFAVAYAMWNMDPGRDSIIYRMTTTRLKKD